LAGQSFPHFIHWCGAYGPAYFQATIEDKYWSWYLTGNPRSVDAARVWIEEMVKHPVYGTGREASGGMSSCIEAYWNTWDPRLPPIIEKFREAMFKLPPGKGMWTEYAPSLEYYHRLTGSEEAKKRILDWTASRTNAYYNFDRLTAYAAWLTELPAARGPVFSIPMAGFRECMPPYRAADYIYPQLISRTFEYTSFAYRLAAEVAQAPLLREPPSDEMLFVKPTAAAQETVFLKPAGTAVHLGLGPGAWQEAKGHVIGPDGQAVAELAAPPHGAAAQTTIEAAAPPGRYVLRCTASVHPYLGNVIFCDAPQCVFPVPDAREGLAFYAPTDVDLFFLVPERTAEFSVRCGFNALRDQMGVFPAGPASFRLDDPSGKEAASFTLGAQAGAEEREIKIEPDLAQTGKPWRLAVSRGLGWRSVNLQGVPRFLSLRSDRLFAAGAQ